MQRSSLFQPAGSADSDTSDAEMTLTMKQTIPYARTIGMV
jgi:hypothetical protein